MGRHWHGQTRAGPGLLGLSALLGAGVSAAAPANHADCAALVPLAEVLRGKGAFLSGCETLSENDLGGCWTQPDNTDTLGCQTCNIQEEAFSTAVFPVMFPDELDPCPTELDYTALYEGEHGPLSVVTAASLTSTGCPEGWLYSGDTDHCYFKSPNTAKAASQTDAVSKCEAEGAWVIAINSEAENDFLLHNLLFTGFFGETYTGLAKETATSEWTWPEESSQTAYSCLEDYSDWLEGPEVGCDSTFNGGADGSCMEIFPYEPKGWNPFSCIVGKHFVCEMPATVGGTVGVTPAPAPTAAATEAPTPAPIALTAAPTVKATPLPTSAPTAADVSATVAPVDARTQAPVAEDDDGSGYGDHELPTTSSASAAPSSTEDDSGADTSSWAGVHLFSITKRLVWTDASYSLYLRDGDVETVVVEGKTKDGLGTATDSYDVRDGCYRLAVTTTGDPTALTWSVTGGDPHGSTESSGEGLDGGLYTVGGGVCDAEACQSSCLSDLFGGDDAEELATDTCDGYSALISGACSDMCPDDDEAGLQQKCVQAGCTPDTACGLNVGGADGLGTEYEVEIGALMGVPATAPMSSAAGAGDAGDEFETAVGLWLGVDPGEVSVTAIDGVAVQEEDRGDVQEEEEEDNARARGLQTDSSSETTFTRYKARVRPANLTLVGATGLQEATAAEGSAVELQDWLREGGGSWQGVSVAALEGEVVEEFVVVSSTSGADDDATGGSGGGDDGGALDNPLLVGGIAAGAVVVAAMVVTLLCRSRAKKKDKERRRRKPARRGSQGSLTHDFEGGGGPGFQASDSRSFKRGGGGGDDIMPLYKDDDQVVAGSNNSSRRPSVSNARGGAGYATAAVADTAGGSDPASPEGGTLFVPVDLGGEVGAGAGAAPAGTMSAAAIAHQQRQQQRRRQHRRRQTATGSGGGRASSPGEVSDPDGGAAEGAYNRPPGSSESGSDGGSQCSTSDGAATVAMSLSAQDSVSGTGSGAGAPQRQANKRGPSSKLAFNGHGSEVRDADTLETKRPSIRGPSGALASLGFARGMSLGAEDDDDSWRGTSIDGDATPTAATADRQYESGSLFDGGSEAGSRYYGTGGTGGESGSSLGTAERRESFGTKQQSAQERIRALNDRQSRQENAVTLKAHDMSLPSPAPFSPGTDWDLAAGLAASPGGAALYQDNGPTGRRRSHMVNPASGVVPDRKVAMARRASRRRGEEGGGQGGGGWGGDGVPPSAPAPPPAAAPAAPAADRSFRPPADRSSSGVYRSGTPARTGVRRGAGGGDGRTPFAQGQRVGSGVGDSDCDTAVGPEGVTPMGAGGGGWGAGAPRTPRAYEDSDGGSRYYGSSAGESQLTPGAVGAAGAEEGRRMMPAKSPLTMVHYREGEGGTA
eukprot:g8524.t1